MVKEITSIMSNRYNKETLTLQLPLAFDRLVYISDQEKLKFEMVKSNTLQPTKLIFEDNIVTDTIAYIFVNSKCQSLEYKHSTEREEDAFDLLKHTFQFKEVTTFKDLTMDEVIQKLNALIKTADDFEERCAR